MSHLDFEENSLNFSNSSPIPSISERLGQLRPSKELLEYYRKKIIEYDNEHEQLVEKLEGYKSSYEDQHKVNFELQKYEDEKRKLQKALSDMQVFLYQEREHVLRLYAENDRLKIRELEDRKKIQHLLSLTRPTDTEITYFVKDHPSNIIQRHNCKEKRNRKENLMGRGPGGHREPTPKRPSRTSPLDTADEKQQLVLQIESLQAQLEEQTKLSREQINSLLEDRRVYIEEHEAQCEKDSDKIKTLSDNLKQTQSLLYESTKDYLEVKYEIRLKERRWMNERDSVLQEMEFIKDKLNLSKEDLDEMRATPGHVNAGTQHQMSATSPLPIKPTNTMVIKQLRSNLEQTQEMAEMYREQIIGLEDELARIREENDCGKDAFKAKTEKLAKRLQLMNQRYEALEKRRGLEIEGFKNDIKLLRKRLKDVEKQLYKVTVNVGENFDLEILNNVHTTATRSKRIAGDLHHLKSKVYGLERDLKNL